MQMWFEPGSLADESPPTKPRRLALAEATPTSVTPTWRRSRDNVRVAGYEVYVPGRPRVRTTRTAYTIRSLACRTTYRIGVAAYDAAGNRSPTRWFAGSTAACVPAPPQHTTTTTTTCCRRPSSPSHREMVRRSRVRSPWTVNVTSGNPASIHFLVDGVDKWTENSSPISTTVMDGELDTTALSDGSHVLVAQARNSGGSEIARVTSRVTVSNTPPSAILTQSPGDGATISGQVTWTVNVTSGNPASIHFFVDGVDKWTENFRALSVQR